MDPSTSLFEVKPLFSDGPPLSDTLQRLEESRAQLLRPIVPSAAWLKSPPIQNHHVPDDSGTQHSQSFLHGKVPSQAEVLQLATASDKKPLLSSGFCEPNPPWLKNPFLKQLASTSFALQGLEETRARLLQPIITSSSKPLDVAFPLKLESPQNFCTLAYTQFPLDPRCQNRFYTELEEEQHLRVSGSGPSHVDGDEMDMAGEIPEYNLPVSKDNLTFQPEEVDLLENELLESKDEYIKELKMNLLSLTCCSLVEGSKFGNPETVLRYALTNACENVADHDPEFILKVALYTRQELNVRNTANFLLALSARLPPCRPYLRRYFCHTVFLPSDWIEVARIFQALVTHEKSLVPMPSCLRTSMADKFRQFDAYQLAKYNTRKSRGKKRQLKTMNRYRSEEDSEPPKTLFSLKALVRRLHISEPAEHVMGLLGRRYPSDLRSFSRSRLPGLWDSSLAGTRMRLPKPLTWERELSQHGNSRKAWELLIDAGKLPFMAMLRNLRNILKVGVGERYHRRLLKRLEDKDSVIRSKQLPFRFLSAYKVIKQLEKDLLEAEKPFPSVAAITAKVREYVKQRRGLKHPTILELVFREKKKLRKARTLSCDRAILQRYCQALEKAIHIAARHNIPPIPGRTVILISCEERMMAPYIKTKDLTLPNLDPEESNAPLKKLDVAMLLGSMVYSVSEQAQIFLCYQSSISGPVAMTGSILKDVQQLRSLRPEVSYDEIYMPSATVMNLLVQRQRVDTILVFSVFSSEMMPTSALWLYRHHVAPDCLCVNTCSNDIRWNMLRSKNQITMTGFNEQILRFVAERGDSRFLDHVEKVDEIYNLPLKRGAARAKEETGVFPLIPAPKNRWRSVRVFVSSTFRDMHGERDLLIRSVFPELRARAAQFCLAIEDIDLRWGITEHESQRNKQLELCLSEVWQSQLFIGILGERYGHVPGEYSLPDEPQYQWVKSYPAGRSITELEAIQFLGLCKNPSAESKAFFYFRDPDFLSSVPETWRADFVAESEEARLRVADLKETLAKREDLASPHSYACQWGGVAQGRPYVKGLDDFGIRVLEDVWKCIQQHYVKEGESTLTDQTEEREEDFLQESFQELQQRRFCARAKLLRTVTTQLQGGKLFVVSGESGQGKTVFLASLAQELRTKTLSHDQGPRPSYHVVAHFTRARPDQAEAQAVFSHLCSLLRRFLEQPPSPARSYRELVGQFESLLHAVAKSLKRQQSLVVLIDGADLIHSANGQLVSDWLPKEIPQRVIFVLSVSEESTLLSSLKQQKNVTTIPLGPLDPSDRVAVVRKDLALYGKKLEESAFNNQMRLVLLKRGSRQPLYLTLLTQDLRLFAMFEKLSERIQKLPVSLPLLLQHLLGCLEQDHGAELVAVSLVLLWASRDGLKERDLYMILSTWKELNGVDITFEEAAVAGRQARAYPMGPFFDFLRSLRGLLGACGSLSEPPGSRMHLCGSPLRAAVERRYLKKLGLDHTAHILLAAHWWKLSDPDGSRTFQNCEAESLRELPYHLVRSGRLDILASFLTDLKVVRIHIRLSLFHCLLEAYALYVAAAGSDSDETVVAFRTFLQKNLRLLSQHPQLLLQQAANEPDSSALCLQAHAALVEKGTPFVKWLNKPQKTQKNDSLVLPLPAVPSCVSVAPSGKLAAVGTVEGTLHLLDMETGQELKSLLSACDGISACAFLSETAVCLGTFDGHLELWSLKEGCRLMGIEAHKARITDCSTNADHRLLATVSLDGSLKIWDSASGCLARERDCSCPLNCVTFHPEHQLVATGGWDRSVTILNADEMTVASVLKDHDASIHSASFSSAGNILATGTMAGSINLWSWQAAVLFGTFSAHTGCVSTVRFLSEGKLLTAGEDCKVQLWMGHLGRHWSTLGSAELSPALCAAASPDGSQLAVGYHEDDVWIYSHPWNSDLDAKQCQADGVAFCSLAWMDNLFVIGGNNKGFLCIWSTLGCDPPCLHKWQGHNDAVTGLAVSGNLVASTSEDFTVRIWLSDTLKQEPKMGSSILPFAVLRGHTGGVTCCAFSQDGCYLATGGKDRALFLWDVNNPTQKVPSLWRSFLFCHQDWVSSCNWIGSKLLSGSNDGTVSLWDPQTGQCLQEFLGHQNPVCGVTSEQDHVVSLGRDGTLIAWDLQGVERTRFMAQPGRANHCAGFTDPGESGFVMAAAGCDGTVNLWKPLAMEQPQLLSGHCAAVSGAAASRASSSFVTVSKDNTVCLWALPKEEEKGEARELPPHSGAVTALAWSPDGQFAVSGGEHGDLVVWDNARAAGTAKAGSSCIWAVAFTSPFTVLVASDGISLWDINTGRQSEGVLSLIHRKRLPLEEESTVLSVGKSKPGGPLVLGLANGTFLVFQPGAETFQHVELSTSVWSRGLQVSFDISVCDKTGILHVWDSMNQPSLFKMRLTSAGTLSEEMASEHIAWEPKRSSVWVTVARLLNEELLLYADTEGYLWNRTWDKEKEEEVEGWDLNEWKKTKIHNDRITSMHVLKDRIVTASYDRVVKIWDRNTMKLLAQFQCLAPVTHLQTCPSAGSSLVLMAADKLGNVYFLEWSCIHS